MARPYVESAGLIALTGHIIQPRESRRELIELLADAPEYNWGERLAGKILALGYRRASHPADVPPPQLDVIVGELREIIAEVEIHRELNSGGCCCGEEWPCYEGALDRPKWIDRAEAALAREDERSRDPNAEAVAEYLRGALPDVPVSTELPSALSR